MDNLVFSCSDALDQAATPACGTDYGERVVRIALMKDGATFAVAASDVPTAAEFETGVSGSVITIINGITNGHRIEQGATELSGDDTETGGTERFDVQYRVEGRIKRFNETVARMTEKLDRFSTLNRLIRPSTLYCTSNLSVPPVSVSSPLSSVAPCSILCPFVIPLMTVITPPVTEVSNSAAVGTSEAATVNVAPSFISAILTTLSP